MKKSFVIMVVVLLFLLVGCESQKYDLLYDISDVSRVQIVEVVSTLDETQYNVLCDIDDIDEFFSEFNKVMFNRYLMGDPVDLSSGKAIKISYNSGDCEYIGYSSQQKTINGVSQFGVYYCDQKDFDNLINKYLN